ncbi:MAG: hypothetical protein HGA36_00915 [Candidatus Moranbacteria bacterium]|nr:hypothetical protein [Candidatus Moranbacteria bacterium]
MEKFQVEKFQQICKKELGLELSYDEALENATKLVEMIRHIYKPIRKDDFEKFIKQ